MIRRVTASTAVWTLLHGSLLACPVCITATDSPAENGISMAIVAMLGVTGAVLVSFAAFFIYLMRRGRAVTREAVMHQPVRERGHS
jgi:hypothetical protein